ncbi:transcriptional regulator [Shewanella xiamenensis]|uniref:winged helix-turn-helix domain-containing protein n=1 Tax=Shewanella xiamenensis TaxID=332186 RepID=UPI0035B85999
MMHLTYDKASNTLHFGNNEKFTITTPERNLLLLLIQSNGAICSLDALIKAAWGGTDYIGPNSLNVAISNLRKILNPKGILIKTMPRQGYFLVSDVFEFKINNVIEPTPTELLMNQAPDLVEVSLKKTSKSEISLKKQGVRFFLKNNILYIIIIFLSLHIILLILDNLVYVDATIVDGQLHISEGQNDKDFNREFKQ